MSQVRDEFEDEPLWNRIRKNPRQAIDGDFFAVMGLPVARMIGLFRTLGWRYDFRGLEAA